MYTEFFKAVCFYPGSCYPFGVMDPDPMRFYSVTPLKPRTCGAFCSVGATLATLAHVKITKIVEPFQKLNRSVSCELRNTLRPAHSESGFYSLVCVCVCACMRVRYASVRLVKCRTISVVCYLMIMHTLCITPNTLSM